MKSRLQYCEKTGKIKKVLKRYLEVRFNPKTVFRSGPISKNLVKLKNTIEQSGRSTVLLRMRERKNAF